MSAEPSHVEPKKKIDLSKYVATLLEIYNKCAFTNNSTAILLVPRRKR